MSVRILTVCTGNICRSPFAQLVLQAGLDEVRPEAFEVSSAGTSGLEGEPVDPGSARILHERGIDASGVLGRRLTSQVLADADIVLGLEVAHRSAVVVRSPRHLQRAYTLREMARLLESADARQPWSERLAGPATAQDRWAALPAHLARERGLSRVDEGADDIADPYRQPQEAFDRMATEIDAAVRTIVAWEASFS